MASVETPEVGKAYRIIDRRKGTFIARVIKVSGEWVDAEIIEGVATYLSRPDDGPGDTVTCRISLCRFEPIA